MRGSERREVLLDFALTQGNLLNNYAALRVDATKADAFILSHGHADHYGALPEVARLSEGRRKPYDVKDRGLVIITSCGHAGVINSIRHIQNVTGITELHAIVRGFHLGPAPDVIVEKTVDALRRLDPDYVLPMPCTGWNTITAIQRTMPSKLVLPSTGTRVIFGA